jgi:hypothetical protein
MTAALWPPRPVRLANGRVFIRGATGTGKRRRRAYDGDLRRSPLMATS